MSIKDITSFLTEMLYWVAGMWEFITLSIPLTVLVLGIPIVGFSFGLLRRLLSK